MKKRIFSLLLVLCMLVAMPVIAMADDAEAKANVRIFNEGGADAIRKEITPGQVLYATNDAEGAVKATTEAAGDWTIKFEFVDDVAVLTLKGAKIQGNSLGHGMYFGGTTDFKVVVEEDSEVNNGTHSCFWATSLKGDLTITGPGKLTLHSTNGSPCSFGNEGDVYIKDAKMEILSEADNTRSGIIKGSGNLIIDHSEINFTVPFGNAIWMYQKYKAGSTTEIVSEGYYLIADEISEKDLIIQNGSKITGTTACYGLGCSGDITVKDSELELTTKNAVFAVKPTLELSSEYGAIAGLKATATQAFNIKKFSQYTYVKIGPGLDAVTGGTTSGGSTSGGTTSGGNTSGGTTSGGTTSGGTTSGGTTATTNPATGDNFNAAFVSVLALTSAAALAAVTVLSKKRVVR